MKDLYPLYGPLGDFRWIVKNAFVFEQANRCGLALGGSIGAALALKGHKKPSRLPGDIDYVCASYGDAKAFMEALERKLMDYPEGHWRVGVNHRNKFTPPRCRTHFRFQSSFWLPICIMIIPEDKFKVWYTEDGFRVQFLEVIKETAAALNERDNKGREAAEAQMSNEAFVVTQGGHIHMHAGAPIDPFPINVWEAWNTNRRATPSAPFEGPVTQWDPIVGPDGSVAQADCEPGLTPNQRREAHGLPPIELDWYNQVQPYGASPPGPSADDPIDF